MVGGEVQLELRKVGERVAEQEAALQSVFAGELFHERLVEPPSFVRFDGCDDAGTVEPREVFADFVVVLLLKKAVELGARAEPVRAVVSDELKKDAAEDRFAVRPFAEEHEHGTLVRYSG